MNHKILEILPKKKNTDNAKLVFSTVLVLEGYNTAIDDCISALEAAGVGIVPSELEICGEINTKVTLHHSTVMDMAKAIRSLMLGKE